MSILSSVHQDTLSSELERRTERRQARQQVSPRQRRGKKMVEGPERRRRGTLLSAEDITGVEFHAVFSKPCRSPGLWILHHLTHGDALAGTSLKFQGLERRDSRGYSNTDPIAVRMPSTKCPNSPVLTRASWLTAEG
jgi:hypothetical protein